MFLFTVFKEATFYLNSFPVWFCFYLEYFQNDRKNFVVKRCKGFQVFMTIILLLNYWLIKPPIFITDVAEAKAFHYEWWFLVIVALTGLIIILVVISLLCLVSRRSKSSKYKALKLTMKWLRVFHPDPLHTASVFSSRVLREVNLIENPRESKSEVLGHL